MPAHFKQTIRSERGRRKLRTAGAALSAVVGLVLVWFLGRYAWMEWEVRRMEQTNAELRPGVEQLREAAAEWELLESAVQPDAFALEWLHRFASRLPDKGVRITLFQLDEKGVFLTGEADRAARVVNYQDGLDSAPELAALELTMPPPKILANNIARFEVTARRKGMADVEAP